MNPIPCFRESHIERLARVLGDCGSGSDISRILNDRGLDDNSGESTKWRRLYSVFLDVQRRDGCANRVLDFVRCFLDPVRFIEKREEFDQHLSKLNTVLAFSGLSLDPDGEFRKRQAVNTLEEAENRWKTIHSKFRDRRLHPEVLKYCKVELLQNNYFHAVFEATKGLAQRIRDKAKVEADGAALIDRVFSGDRPLLAFNSLQSTTEKSEQRGLASLLKGCFGAVRNPLAHGPKILWKGENDAADYLSLISLLHYKLDDCQPTGYR